MPQIYSRSPIEPQPTRRRPSSAPVPSSSSMERRSTSPVRPILPELTDADDAIVLSDLVRTGEASRLRRRGAMRFDHGHSHGPGPGPGPGNPTNIPEAPRASSPGIVLVERSNWDSDSDLDTPVFAGHSPFSSSSRTRRRHVRPSRRYGPYSSASSSAAAAGMTSGLQPQEGKDDYTYTLVCGAELADYEADEIEAFKPSILPLYPPSQTASTSKKGTKRTTGCGAAIHLHAAPRPRFRVWAARSAATESVVPMDACYFDTKEAARFSRSPCGCVKEGIGCAVCGNPLGTRYTPCKSASDGFFCTRQSDKIPSSSIHPNPHTTTVGPASYSRVLGTPKHHIYTFFADAVSPTPSYTFPTRKSSASRLRSGLGHDGVPVSPDASPSPRFASLSLPPEPYIYTYDEDEDEESENNPWLPDTTYYGPGWRPITGPGVDSSGSPTSPPAAGTSSSLFLTSAPDTRGTILDRYVPSSPALVVADSDPWGQAFPGSEPQPQLRTRNGRTARRSTMGRLHPSLSSGLAGGTQEEPVSFYQQQIITAWERERGSDINFERDFGQWFASDPLTSTTADRPTRSATLDAASTATGDSRVVGVNPDGDVVGWGAVLPDATWGTPDIVNPGIDWTQIEQEAEYKPSEGLGFVDR